MEADCRDAESVRWQRRCRAEGPRRC
uniref:Uncharacterized protein n=1 Tax=Arundo donax TaxID=35708 RepID=A0A0A9EHK4_ARUDO